MGSEWNNVLDSHKLMLSWKFIGDDVILMLLTHSVYNFFSELVFLSVSFAWDTETAQTDVCYSRRHWSIHVSLGLFGSDEISYLSTLV